MADDDCIRFYDPKNKWYILSNYYLVNIIIGGRAYPSSEHYFQSEKFRGNDADEMSVNYSEIIRQAKTPNIARELASQKIKGGYRWRTDLNEIIREYSEVKFNEKEWLTRRDNVMRKIVFQKFFQNSELRDKLISTGTREIIEDSPRDSYWGIGKDGTGSNILGKILVETRFILSGGRLGNIPTPFSRSNWVIPGVLLASSYPGSENCDEHKSILEGLLSSGVNAFVNLQTPTELERFRKYTTSIFGEDYPDRTCWVGGNILTSFPERIFYANIPIPDRGIISDEKILDLVGGVMNVLIPGGKNILIHCFGGKGRTGTVMCCVFGKLYGLNSSETLKFIERIFSHRLDKGRRVYKIPQTACQISQVKRILG